MCLALKLPDAEFVGLCGVVYLNCGGGYVKLINKFSGLAIDISDNGTENGTKIQQWQDTGADAQRFHLIPVSN